MRKVLVATMFFGSLLVGGYALLPSGAAMPGRQILAASAALPAGTLLREQDVVWQTVSGTEPDQIVRSVSIDCPASAPMRQIG